MDIRNKNIMKGIILVGLSFLLGGCSTLETDILDFTTWGKTKEINKAVEVETVSGVIIGKDTDYLLLEVEDGDFGKDVFLVKWDDLKFHRVGDEIQVAYDQKEEVGTPIKVTATSIYNSTETKRKEGSKIADAFVYETAIKVLKEKNTNVSYSPVSAYMSITMLAEGSKGVTKDEFESLLGGLEKAREYSSEIAKRQIRTETSKLIYSNSLWLTDKIDDKMIDVSDIFLDLAKDTYNSDIYTVPFGNKRTDRKMSKWLTKKTANLVDTEVSTKPGDSVSVLNAIYLKDDWATKFTENNNTKRNFKSSVGNVKLEYMSGIISSPYVETEDYIKSSLKLENSGEMFFILPKTNIGTILTDNDLKKIIKKEGEDVLVNWELPKFTANNTINLSDIIIDLGVPRAFSNEADFGGLLSGVKVYINQIKQGVQISINENGIEGDSENIGIAEARALIMAEKDFILDKPFIYGITDKNGNLLFIGKMVEP